MRECVIIFSQFQRFFARLFWFNSLILFWFDSNHSLIVITVTNQSYNCYCYHQFPGNGDRCDFCVCVFCLIVCLFVLLERAPIQVN